VHRNPRARARVGWSSTDSTWDQEERDAGSQGRGDRGSGPIGTLDRGSRGEAVNTLFIAQMTDGAQLASPVVGVGTTVKVTRRVSVRRGKRRGTVRFRGRVRPAVDGRAVLIQKLRRHGSGGWFNVGRTFARHTGQGYSSYRRKIRQRRGGRYRVLVEMNDVYSSSASRSIKVRRVRR
jgi:hypothetical protein